MELVVVVVLTNFFKIMSSFIGKLHLIDRHLMII